MNLVGLRGIWYCHKVLMIVDVICEDIRVTYHLVLSSVLTGSWILRFYYYSIILLVWVAVEAECEFNEM